MVNDLSHLAQKVGSYMSSRTNTIFFIHLSKILKHKKVMYYRLVLSIRAIKIEFYYVQVTIASNRLEYEGYTILIPAQLSTIKIYLNSTI